MSSEPMLTLHDARDRRLGPVKVIRGRTGPFARELRALGYSYRRRSGAVAAGGPGTVVPGDYVVPASRWGQSPGDHGQLLRAGTHLLLLKANGAPLARIVAAEQELVALVRARKQQAAGQAARATGGQA